MSVDAALDLLFELQQLGIELVVRGDRIQFRPQRLLSDELRGRLVEHKPTLIPLLTMVGDGEVDVEAEPFMELEPILPPRRGAGATCSVCWDARWWRIPSGPWTCGRCHPPLPGLTDVEWAS